MILPHCTESERQVLGSLMVAEPHEIDLIFSRLTAEAFYSKRYQEIFTACHALYVRSGSIDPVSLSNVLGQTATVEYLTGIAGKVLSSANVEFHVGEVLDYSRKRRIIELANEAIKQANDAAVSSTDIIAAQDAEMFRLSQGAASAYRHIRDISIHGIQRLEAAYHNPVKITGVPSYYSDIDFATSGWQPQDMIILAARPSVGKTALALNIAYQQAMHGRPVGFFSLEMSALALWRRLASLHNRIDSAKLMSGRVTAEEVGRVVNAEMNSIPLFIDDSCGQNVAAIRNKARVMVRKEKVEMIYVDYIGLIAHDGKQQNRNEQVTEISGRLKGLAKELDIPVMVLCQMSRTSTRAKQRPSLIDLRESGAIEQDADIVIFLYRPDMNDISEREADRRDPELLIEKFRNGKVGTLEMRFEGEYGRFSGVDHTPGYEDKF